MPETIEIQVNELSEIKTSSKGTKYFAVNKGAYVCFKTDLHPVFANLQGQTIKANITPPKEQGKSARIESLATPTPQKPTEATKTAPQQATQPKEHLAQAVKQLSGDSRDRAVALSYSKDLVAAGIIGIADIFPTADKFLKYILNNK